MTESELVREVAQPLTGSADDYGALLELIGEARLVLLGEASHGTHEFYFERATITKRLIAQKGFTVLAIEADWPDAARVHRYVRGTSEDPNALEALSGFRRFPTWMWRNTVVVEFVDWLRGFNKDIDPKRAPAGFYGMDLYSLHASIDAVLNYLEKIDPDAARGAIRPTARARNWGDLPAGNRTVESLFSCATAGAIRRDHSHRRDAGGGTARTYERLG